MSYRAARDPKGAKYFRRKVFQPQSGRAQRDRALVSAKFGSYVFIVHAQRAISMRAKILVIEIITIVARSKELTWINKILALL